MVHVRKKVTAVILAVATMFFASFQVYAEENDISVADRIAIEENPDNFISSEYKETEQVSKFPVTKENLPEYLDSEHIKSKGFVSRLKSEELSLSEVVLEKNDGTRALYLFDKNIKYKDKNGKIIDKSNKAVLANENGNQSYKSEANNIDVSLPLEISSAVTLQYDDINISVRPIFNQSNKTHIIGRIYGENSILYTNVFDSTTDIKYTFTYDGVKEDIVLKKYNGKNSFDFEVMTDGLKLTENKGTLLLIDENGKTKASLGEVVVFSADNKNNTYGEFTITEKEKNNKYIVTISVDTEYLTNPDTVYPVTIDPPIQVTDTDCSLQDLQVFKGTDGSGNTETSAGLSGVSRVGWTDWGACRTLVKLDGLAFSNRGIVYASQITDAYIEMRDLMCQGGAAVPITCVQFEGEAWDETDQKTWNQLRVSESTNISTPIGVTYGKGNSQRDLADKNQWYRWNILPIVKNWKKDTTFNLINKGLEFKTYLSSLESSVTYAGSMKTFCSIQGNSQYRPYFCIEYKYRRMIYNAITELKDKEEDKDLTTANNIVSGFGRIGYAAYFRDRQSITNIIKDANNKCDILVFHGHGSPGRIKIESKADGTELHLYSESPGYNLSSISADTWKDISFVYFATCESGKATSNRNSMIDEANELGAKCVIGFNNTVSGAEDFLKYMIDFIATSDTLVSIEDAVTHAKVKSLEKAGITIENQNQINTYLYQLNSNNPAYPTNLRIVGDQSICLDLTN